LRGDIGTELDWTAELNMTLRSVHGNQTALAVDSRARALQVTSKLAGFRGGSRSLAADPKRSI